MDVKLVRLTSGEDIICDVLKDDEDYVTFTNAIVAVPAGNGQIGFAPWAPLLSETVKELTIDKKFILYVSIPQSKITEEYKSMFSSIITPNKSLSL